MPIFVAETSKKDIDTLDISIKKEISRDELERLNSAFFITGIYHSITQIHHIVLENGTDFKNYMTQDNLNSLLEAGTSPHKMIMQANKYVLNYASSIKTYIDMESRLLKKHKSPAEEQAFHDLCCKFYDEHMEYRFWANFRNYIVHCEFPYTQFHAEIDGNCEVICSKEHLLNFKNWKQSKADILLMEDIIDLPSLVDNMSAMIYALYLNFFTFFGEDIAKGTTIYSEFCKKYDVEKPIIVEVENISELHTGHLQPLPVEDLYNAVSVLSKNPNVNINYKK